MNLVTVLLPVYNAAQTLSLCIESVRRQTCAAWKLLIVDDGSTDNSLEIAHSYSESDPRIQVVVKGRNTGIRDTLNYGLSLIQTPLVARIDADDIAVETRLEKQIVFLQSQPEIALVGSAVQLFSDYDTEAVKQCPECQKRANIILPQTPAMIHWSSCFYCPVAHPSVMFRTFDRYHHLTDEPFPRVEDFEQWSYMLQQGQRLANLTEVLTRIRKRKPKTCHKHCVHTSNEHKTDAATQGENSVKICILNIVCLLPKCTNVERDEILLQRLIDPSENIQSVTQANETLELLNLLVKRIEQVYDENQLIEVHEDADCRRGEIVIRALQIAPETPKEKLLAESMYKNWMTSSSNAVDMLKSLLAS